jgi:flagellar basal body-associated protein FliL
MSNKDEIIVIKGDEEENKKHRRLIAILIAILLSIALITYSGVNLIYSPSTITVGVAKPPLYWEKGGAV